MRKVYELPRVCYNAHGLLAKPIDLT